MNEDENRRSIGDQARGRDARHPAVIAAALVACLLLTVSGCLPIPIPFLQRAQSEPTRRPPTATPTNTPVGFPTWPPTWTPTWTPTATATGTRFPTLTPRPGTPIPWMPAPGGGTSPGAGPTSDPRGTLRLDFWFTDKYCTASTRYAAEFWIQAQGGGGGYTYYLDIDKIAGPVAGGVSYKLKWRECGGAPGTFFVHSADGQQVAKLFWVEVPDCCVKVTPVP